MVSVIEPMKVSKSMNTHPGRANVSLCALLLCSVLVRIEAHGGFSLHGDQGRELLVALRQRAR